MRDQMLSSIASQDVDTSEHQVSDLDYVEFYWKNDQPDVDAVFGSGIITFFPNNVLRHGGGRISRETPSK